MYIYIYVYIRHMKYLMQTNQVFYPWKIILALLATIIVLISFCNFISWHCAWHEIVYKAGGI